ncbi:preprotein translocase subunit SecG [Rickettsia endosymbiont of Cardiosporidium cionae]|uniref:preprotein translocase subunit SecG n=1 Tax=Rickettsia endosymbiont of Cardiosporidium cionae TaxID=2777155 RepID=UPI0018962948|nr:preprotein translocase subunit SecG [Rickettsia endosymbiont of Cardiosporidium cionae]KAF8818172.1 hypothetical protein IHI24_000624 [Rickettsia endosymbiont of Cardiosporidium cionae]
MMNSLLFVHLIVSILLVLVILLQNTSTDSITGINSESNNMGLLSARAKSTLLVKTTSFLGIIFFVNALILANLAINKEQNDPLTKKLEQKNDAIENKLQDNVPIAK